MNYSLKNKSAGFSLLELIVAMTVTLILMGVAATLFSGALGVRERESRRTDALASVQAALNLMSREIANSGYGLTDNGIAAADSGQRRLHFRANIQNNDAATDDAGEDVTYYYDISSQSIVRYDRFGSPQTSIVVNRTADLTFQYFDYSGSSSTPTSNSTPTASTGRVRITVIVKLDPVQGQPDNQTVTYTSDVTLRNSNYMLNQY